MGTRIVAAIEVSESVLQSALQHVRGLPRTMTISVAPANRIIVGYGAFHATAVLAPMMDSRAPRIELELRSTILAWGLKRAINIPAVSVSGRRVAIDLDRVPALADFSAAWQHLRAVRFATAEGRLFVNADVAVEVRIAQRDADEE